MVTLNEAAQNTLKTLRKFFRRNKYLPSTREIAELLGYGSKSKTQVLRILRGLVETDYLGKTDSGRYIPGENFFAYPLFHGVRAGDPTDVFSDSSDFIDLESYVVNDPDTSFFITVRGDSMQEAGILSGDIVVVQHSVSAKPGDVVVANLGGEFTVKTFQKDKEGIPYLQPANRKYQDIKFTEGSEVKLIGKVTGVIRRVN